MKETEQLLKTKGVTPTPVRLLVYHELKGATRPLSLSDIETVLESVDKSTISRTLSTFREHHLIHSFTDGSGSLKYEICNSTDTQSDNDKHVHFRCEKCGQTICLTTISVPIVTLPEGFSLHEINYVVSGTCDRCNHI